MKTSQFFHFFYLSLILHLVFGCGAIFGQTTASASTPPPPTNTTMSRTTHSTTSGDDDINNWLKYCFVRTNSQCGRVYGWDEHYMFTPMIWNFLLENIDVSVTSASGQAATVSNIQFYLVDPIAEVTGNVYLTHIGFPYAVNNSWVSLLHNRVYYYITFEVEFCSGDGEITEDYDFDISLSGKYEDTSNSHSNDGEEGEGAGTVSEFENYTIPFTFTNNFTIASVIPSIEGTCDYYLEPPFGENGTDRTGINSFGTNLDVEWQADLYPNPSTSSSILSLHVEQEDEFRLEIYDLSGRLVESPGNQGRLTAGLHSFKLNLNNQAPGLYVVRVSTPTKTKTMKLLRTTE